MSQKTFFRVLVLIFAFAALGAPRSTLSQNPQADGYRQQTSVALIPRGPDGQQIQLTRADIYLDVWNGGKLAPLPRNGHAATLRLDQEWLCSEWTDLCRNHVDPARIVLQADGYAPVTAIVDWPGQTRPAGLEFSGGRNFRIAEGATQNIDVAFRRSSTRFVRIVEENGAPSAGIDLDAWLYFAATSHGGGIEGESLASGKTELAPHPKESRRPALQQEKWISLPPFYGKSVDRIDV
jgi:hypothetical protein